MSSARILDGKAVAESVLAEIADRVAALRRGGGAPPGVVLVQIGDDSTSARLLSNKHKRAAAVGVAVRDVRLPADVSGAAVSDLIGRLNADPEIHGILVQLPLPPALPADTVLAAIDPDKDIDGLHPRNAERLAEGGDGLVACTPLGCLLLIRQVWPDIGGLNAVVLGRSRLVGTPMAHLLRRAGARVTVLHSASDDEPEVCRHADILISATGKPGLVRGGWIKPGATVIDVGQTRLDNGVLVGDVSFDEAVKVAGAITPVPGGVGPMTITMLISNVVEACFRQRGLPYDRDFQAAG